MISPMAADHPDHRRQVNLFNDCDYIVGGYYDSLRKSLAGLGWAAFTLSIVPVGYRLALCFSMQ